MVLTRKFIIAKHCPRIFKIGFLYLSLTLLLTAVFAGNLSAQIKNVPENEKVFELGMLRDSFINVNINDASVAINTWANELRKNLNIDANFKLVIFDNTQEMMDYNAKKNLGMVILNSIDFLKLRGKMSLYPIFTSSDSKNIYSRLLIITTRPNAENISDLKGEKIGFYLRRNNPIPEFWVNVLLSKNNLGTENKFFSQITEFQSESQLILSVFFGQTDVGIVTESAFETMNELNPQIGKKIKILQTSPGFIFDISSLTKGSREYSYSDQIKKDAVDLSQYPAGKELLTLMKTVQVVQFKPDFLKNTEILYNEYNEIKK